MPAAGLSDYQELFAGITGRLSREEMWGLETGAGTLGPRNWRWKSGASEKAQLAATRSQCAKLPECRAAERCPKTLLLLPADSLYDVYAMTAFPQFDFTYRYWYPIAALVG